MGRGFDRSMGQSVKGSDGLMEGWKEGGVRAGASGVGRIPIRGSALARLRRPDSTDHCCGQGRT
eukprot:3152807-Rhodomonas_salina.2